MKRFLLAIVILILLLVISTFIKVYTENPKYNTNIIIVDSIEYNIKKIDLIEYDIKQRDSIIYNITQIEENEIKEAEHLDDSSAVELFYQLVSR